MIGKIYGVYYTDLPSVRALDWTSLMQLEMEDLTYGWSIEMQIKAAKRGLRITEVDVRTYPRTAGHSKVSGTLKGVVGAGVKIVTTIYRYR